MDYVHTGIVDAIYYRGIKPTNIFMDDELNSYVANFVLTRIIPKEGESHMMMKILGMHDYLAPKYAFYIHRQERCIYFWNFLLEIMSSGKALDTSSVLTFL